jgi:SAM-dependent MidA family methyltransferase
MSVGQIIFEEIRHRGPITFSRFMELALYCPEYGFYEKEADTVGRRGDFFTSVSVGSLFGQLLAFHFSGQLEQLANTNSDTRPQLLEAGAHDGRLAADILTWLRQHRPQLYQAIDYIIVEPSARRRSWQQTTLADFRDQVRWRTDVGSTTIDGILFANELLDALPVRRVGWDVARGQWFEWGVTIDHHRLAWTRMNLSTDDSMAVARALGASPELLAVLPDGFTTEVSPQATEWWVRAARALAHGQLVTLDYGLSVEELFQPQRAQGTLRSYHRHQLIPDVLTQPGEQDITAHVNFSAVRAAGEAAGLRTEFLGSQSRFLTQIGTAAWKQNGGFGDWGPVQVRQFQTLTHPDHLGSRFRVLVQSR